MTLALTGGTSNGIIAAPKKTAAPKSSTSLASSLSSSIPQAITTTTTPVNYDSLLAGDTQLGAQNAQINAQGITNQAQLTEAQQRAFVQYGAIPGGIASALSGDLSAATDPTTAALAQQATAGGVSTTAQLAKAYANQTQSDNASLAARGLIHSGAYGQHANDDLSNYNVAGYQAQQSLEDYLNGLYSGYQTQQQALQQQTAQDTNDALQRIITQIGNGTLGAGNNGIDVQPGYEVVTGPTGSPYVTTPSIAASMGLDQSGALDAPHIAPGYEITTVNGQPYVTTPSIAATIQAAQKPTPAPKPAPKKTSAPNPYIDNINPNIH